MPTADGAVCPKDLPGKMYIYINNDGWNPYTIFIHKTAYRWAVHYSIYKDIYSIKREQYTRWKTHPCCTLNNENWWRLTMKGQACAGPHKKNNVLKVYDLLNPIQYSNMSYRGVGDLFKSTIRMPEHPPWKLINLESFLQGISPGGRAWSPKGPVPRTDEGECLKYHSIMIHAVQNTPEAAMGIQHHPWKA